MVELLTAAAESGTYVITAVFTDEDGNSLIPNTIKWSLKTRDGVVVNSRSSQAVSSPSATENIVLSGDDLSYLSDYDDGRRVLTLYGTYDSSYGTGLTFAENVHFEVENLI